MAHLADSEIRFRRSMTGKHRRKLSLAAAALAVGAGVLLQVHDTPLIAASIAAAGLLWSTRRPKAWLIAGILVAGGLYWSTLDPRYCSTWYRGRPLFAKLTGQLPYVGGDDLSNAVFSACQISTEAFESLATSVVLVEEKTFEGQELTRYRTKLGDFWIPAPGRFTLGWMIWELTEESVYESREVEIHPGDTVIDCGAHVGLFTRFALSRGASRVVAIEPDPTNLHCLRENLAGEIAEGKVTVIEAGVWETRTKLTLWQPEGEGSSGAKSFVRQFKEGLEGVPVMPLDDIVSKLNLERVDFIKMDIEGSERHALRGAKQTLERFKPRLAICTYHRPDDAAVVPKIIGEARSDYRVHAKDLDFHRGPVIPKVVFFE